MKRKKISEIRWEHFYSAARLLDAAYYVYRACCFNSSISTEGAQRELDEAWKAWSVCQWAQMREHAANAIEEIEEAISEAERVETLAGPLTQILEQAISHIENAIKKG